MSSISTVHFARLVRVSRSWLGKLLRLLDFQPFAKVKGMGGIRYEWSRTQVLAVMTLVQLDKMGVSTSAAIKFCQGLGATTDEAFELMVDQRRTWAMVAGNGVHPELQRWADIKRCIEERGEELEALGIRMTPVNLGPLFNDITNAVKEARGEGSEDVRADAE